MTYPVWICDDCGMKYGRWYQNGDYIGPKHNCATYHLGECDVCGKDDVPVTEPRDYGHVVDHYRERIKEQSKKVAAYLEERKNFSDQQEFFSRSYD